MPVYSIMSTEYSWSEMPINLSEGKGPVNPYLYNAAVQSQLFNNPSALYPYGQSQFMSPYTDYNITDVVLSATSPYDDDYLADSPYVTSIGYDMYGNPVLGVYKNLNADPYIRSRMTDLYYYKTLEKWLESDLQDVLNYFTVRDGKAHLIKSFDQYNPVNVDKDSDTDKHKKMELLKDLFLTKEFINKVLKKYVNETGKNWYDLTKSSNDYNIKNLIKEEMIRKIKKSIKMA